jgi:hypothetical protein
VYAVLALVHESRWDPSRRELRGDVRYEFGRRMTTSTANKISPSADVTPDCVVQTDPRRGLVAEAKLGLPKDEANWDDDIKQIQKYDDDLLGWWTPDEQIERFDIVGLVPLVRAVKFADRLESGVQDGKWKFGRHWSIVGFFKTSGVREFMTLKKERGQISDPAIDSRLRESVPIAFDLLIPTYQDRKFVDHRPPLPYLLQIMWDYLFTQYAADVPIVEGGKAVSLHVTLRKVTGDLQLYYGFRSSGTRSPEIPRAGWVRKALDLMVESRMAKMVGDDEYLISYKRTRGDTLKKFGRLCFKAEQKKRRNSPGQLSLLPPGI